MKSMVCPNIFPWTVERIVWSAVPLKPKDEPKKISTEGKPLNDSKLAAFETSKSSKPSPFKSPEPLSERPKRVDS